MKQCDISFVILEYHCLEDLRKCVHSIYDKCSDIAYEIIVSSNSLYPPERQEIILKDFPGLQWIFNETNLGFAKAMNVGISLAAGKGVVIINPDACLYDGSMRAAYQYLISQKDIGVLGPKTIDKYGNLQDSCRKFMKPIDVLIRTIKRIFSKNDVLLYPEFNYNRIQEVDWVIGAFMMLKRAALEKVGMLDEGYFLYVEDMDWCKRFWDCGFKVIYYPDLIVQYKADRKSTNPLLRKKGFFNKYSIYHIKSYLRFLRKHRLFFLN